MRNPIDLVLKIALGAAIVLTAFIKDSTIKAMIVLGLAALTTALTAVKFKTGWHRRNSEKIADIIALLLIVGAAVYIVCRDFLSGV